MIAGYTAPGGGGDSRALALAEWADGALAYRGKASGRGSMRAEVARPRTAGAAAGRERRSRGRRAMISVRPIRRARSLWQPDRGPALSHAVYQG